MDFQIQPVYFLLLGEYFLLKFPGLLVQIVLDVYDFSLLLSQQFLQEINFFSLLLNNLFVSFYFAIVGFVTAFHTLQIIF